MKTETSDEMPSLRVAFSGVPDEAADEAVSILRKRGYDIDAVSDTSEADCVVTRSENGDEPQDDSACVVYDDSSDYGVERIAAGIEARAEVPDAPEDGYFSLNQDWEFTYLNPRAGEILGVDETELLGENVWDEFPEAVGESFYDNYHKTMVEREPVSFEEFYEPFGTLFRVNVYPSDEGISVQFRAVTEDGEDGFLEARAIDRSGVGLCLVSPEGDKIRYVNDSFVSLTGYDENEVVGEGFDVLYGDETDDAAVEEVRAAFDADKPTDMKLVLYRRDGVRYWSHLYITPIYDGGELAYYLCSQRDISETKKREEELRERNRYLSALRDAENGMISASSLSEVGDLLEASSSDFFDDATFYVWDDGVLRSSEDEVPSGSDDPTWIAFSERRRVVPDGGRVEIPVSDKAVLSLRTGEMSDAKEDFVASLVSGAETALERVDREDELRDLTRRLEARNDELRRLSKIDTAVRALVQKIVRLDSRDEIERAVCDHLADVEGWDYVWIGEMTDNGAVPRAWSSAPALADRLADTFGSSPMSEAAAKKETRVVRDVALEDASGWRSTVLDEGFLSSVSVPVVHGVRDFGVLELYSESSDAFGGGYSEALVDAAAVVGYSLASAERREMVLSGGYVRLRLRFDADDLDSLPAAVAHDTGAEVRVEGVAPRPDGAVLYLSVDADDAAVERAAEDHPATVGRAPTGYEADVSDAGLIDHAVDVGGRVVSYTPDDGADTVSVEIDISQNADASGFVNRLSELGYDADVTAKTAHTDSHDSLSTDDLTERQEEILRTAYLEGFFDWPRETDGNELSDSLGIARSTLHQHLRSAEKKLVSDAVEGNPVE